MLSNAFRRNFLAPCSHQNDENYQSSLYPIQVSRKTLTGCQRDPSLSTGSNHRAPPSVKVFLLLNVHHERRNEREALSYTCEADKLGQCWHAAQSTKCVTGFAVEKTRDETDWEVWLWVTILHSASGHISHSTFPSFSLSVDRKLLTVRLGVR